MSSRCSSTPNTFPSCDDRQFSIDQNLCAEVLGRLGLIWIGPVKLPLRFSKSLPSVRWMQSAAA